MFIKKTRRKAGFTLLELLLVLSLAPIVFFAVYSNFSMGVRLWQRLQLPTPEEDAVIFSLRAQRDFTNAMRYSPKAFEGGSAEVAFVTGIETEEAAGGSRAIGLVRYFYDERSRSVLREVKDFSEMYRDAPGKSALALRGVSSFAAGYLLFDPESKKYEWNDAYTPEKPGELPLAVRLSYRLPGSGETTEQTFFIPSGGALT